MSTFGVIVTTRSMFPGALALDARAKLAEKLTAAGHRYYWVSEEEVKYGAVENFGDAKKCAALFQAHRDEIDGVLVCLPNFGDESSVSAALDLAKLDVPVLLVALDDDLDALDLAHRRDAFCGKLSLAANLYHYGIKFTNTRQHTMSLDSPLFDKELARFAAVCRIVRGVRGSRIGMIGTRPGPFQTVRFSEKLLQRSGISVCVADLSTIMSAARNLADDNPQVLAKAEQIRNYGHISPAFADELVVTQAKLCHTVETWLQDNACDAYAMQCWDSLEYNYGCAACLGMSMLGEAGIPGACETDVLGALSMLAMRLACESPAGYLDWNNNYGEDRDKCIGIHCANYPKSFLGYAPEIGALDVLSATIPAEYCFGACKGQVAPGPLTFAKISTDEFKGVVKFYTGEGEFTGDPIHTPGGSACIQVKGLQKLMDYAVKNGFEHHVCMGRGLAADAIYEAFTNYFGWEGYRHEG